MKIVVAVRCFNEEKNINRFMRGYDFADQVIVSDGGSEDDSVLILKKYPKVQLHHFREYEVRNGHRWNPDAPHMNYVLDKAKELEPDFVIFDDMDCVPNYILRDNARYILETCTQPQVNAFRLYMWGDDQYFPDMNNHFDPNYTSLWAWKPKEIDIHADPDIRHGTFVGISSNHHKIEIPMCLLHKSWHPDTIEKKMEHYNKLDLPMRHPFDFAGNLERLPSWASE